jgi:1-acyl-sn-glycerol-3-phosphate acyltransferase
MVRLALKIFCRKIGVSDPEKLETEGPLLITANHPNSFLDAIIIGAMFRREIHFLARGDAFNKPWHNKMLRLLHMVPVYRLSEGKQHLFLNEEAFRRSKEILEKNGIVLIFIEGICKHTHTLQPFKKGAARIAIENTTLKDFRILPLGIAYDSFKSFGKKVNITIGDTVNVKTILPFEEEARNMRHFNETLHARILQLINIPTKNITLTGNSKYLFSLPGILGYTLHLPLYSLLKNIVRKKTAGTVFYDSVLFCTLLFLYPLYLLLLLFFLWLLRVPMAIIFCILLIHPLTAWCAVQMKRS